MNSVFKIHDTVLKVSDEAKILIPEMPLIKSEIKLLSELILCILSSQERYEVALGAMKVLQAHKALKIPKTKSELKRIGGIIDKLFQKPIEFKVNKKLYSRRLRFNVKKSQYILKTIEKIYLNDLTILKILKSQSCIQETRKIIIKNTIGLGPKQASMFLRNIGYHSEFAVLDKHVIDYMNIMGLTQLEQNSFSNINSYQKVETKLKLYAETYNIKLLHLDLAIWTTMRTIKKYYA